MRMSNMPLHQFCIPLSLLHIYSDSERQCAASRFFKKLRGCKILYWKTTTKKQTPPKKTTKLLLLLQHCAAVDHLVY